MWKTHYDLKHGQRTPNDKECSPCVRACLLENASYFPPSLLPSKDARCNAPQNTPPSRWIIVTRRKLFSHRQNSQTMSPGPRLSQAFVCDGRFKMGGRKNNWPAATFSSLPNRNSGKNRSPSAQRDTADYVNGAKMLQYVTHNSKPNICRGVSGVFTSVFSPVLLPSSSRFAR